MKHFNNFNNYIVEKLIIEGDDDAIIAKIGEIDDQIEDFDPEHSGTVSKLKKVMAGDKDTIARVKQNVEESKKDIAEKRKEAQLAQLEASDLEEGFAVDAAVLSGDPAKVLSALNKYASYRKKAIAEYKKLGVDTY